MAQVNSDFLQITKKNVLPAVFACFLFSLTNCFQPAADQNDERKWCIAKTDTLWLKLSQTRQNFKYSMDEIAIRKEAMAEELRWLGMQDGRSLIEMEKSEIVQYHSVSKVYKPLASQYKNAVIKAEDLFYRIKSFEKMTKAGKYDGKLNEFKTTWNEINAELEACLKESEFIADQLVKVEPMFVRLSPKIQAIMDRLGYLEQ